MAAAVAIAALCAIAPAAAHPGNAFGDEAGSSPPVAGDVQAGWDDPGGSAADAEDRGPNDAEGSGGTSVAEGATGGESAPNAEGAAGDSVRDVVAGAEGNTGADGACEGGTGAESANGTRDADDADAANNVAGGRAEADGPVSDAGAESDGADSGADEIEVDADDAHSTKAPDAPGDASADGDSDTSNGANGAPNAEGAAGAPTDARADGISGDAAATPTPETALATTVAPSASAVATPATDATAAAVGPAVTVLDPSKEAQVLPAQYFSRIGDANGNVTVSISDNGALHYSLVSGAIPSGQQHVYNVDLDYLGKLSGDAGFTLTLQNAVEDIYGNIFDIVAKFSNITSSRALSSSEKGYVLARVLGLGGETNDALLSPNAYTKAIMYDNDTSITGPGISMDIEVSFRRDGIVWSLPAGASYNLEFSDIDVPEHIDGRNLNKYASYSEQITVRSGMETAYIPCAYNENGSDYTCWITRNGSEITFKAGNEEGRTAEQIAAANSSTKSGFIGTFTSSVISLRWAGNECGTNLLNLQNTYASIRIRKQSADTSVTDGNSSYSLAGAVYGVYSNYACTSLLCTMTTDASGVAVSNNLGMNLVTGTYYVKEISASAGYKLNESVWTVRATSAGAVYEIVCPETPVVTTIRLVKESASAGMTAGNVLYSLAGAQYGVYASAADAAAKQNRVWLLTTEADGRSGLVTGSYSGTYYIRELAASSGYELDTDIHAVTVYADAANVFTFDEAPQSATLSLAKADSDLGSGAGAQGDGTLQGALFRWTYYAGYYSTEAEAKAAGAGSRTWVFSTDVAGSIAFDAAHLVAGGALYYDENGNAALPVGTVFVAETKASTGYLLNPDVFYAWISGRAGEAAYAVWMTPGFYGCVEEDVARSGLQIAKWDAELNARTAQGDGTLAAKVEVVNASAASVLVGGRLIAPGEVALRATLSAEGLWTSAPDALPYGTYIVRETEAPQGYLASARPRTVEVREDGAVVSMDSDALALKDEPIRGGIVVAKWDSELNARVAQGDGTLAASFEVVNASSASVLVDGRLVAPGEVAIAGTLSAEGLWDSALDALPYGTYTVRETAAPDGYLRTAQERTLEVRAQRVAVSMNTDDLALKDDPVRGGILVAKWDAELNERTAQGDGSLAAKIEVVNASASAVLVGDLLVEPGEVALRATLSEDGLWESAADALPYGTYTVREAFAPQGYRATAAPRTVEVRADGAVVSLDNSDFALKDDPVRGGILVAKWDAELNERTAQGDGSLAAQVEIVNASAAPVLVNGTLVAYGQVALRATLSEDGLWESAADALPYGTYTVRETAAPQGYLLTAQLRTVEVRENGAVVSLDTDELALKDDPVRGGIDVAKWDAELNERTAQGDGSLAASFEIVNASAASVLVGGVLVAPGQVALRATLTENGLWATAPDALPYGTYTVRETAAPQGYLLTAQPRTVEVREHRATVSMDTDGLALKDDPVRGGILVAKWDAELNERTAQGDGSLAAQVEIVNASAASVLVGGVLVAPGQVAIWATLSEDGLWESAADALPYGTYTVRETAAPQGYLLTAQLRTVEVRENGAVVSLDTDELALKDDPVRGGIDVAKWDAELNERTAQGDGSLAASFEIVNASAASVLVGGVLVAPGQVALRATLTENGLWATAPDALPYGTYTVRETAAPQGYLLTAQPRTVEVRADRTVVSLDCDALALKDDPIRGRILVEKELVGSDGLQADPAALQGIRIEVVNVSEAAVLVGSRLVESGAIATVLTLDSCGTAYSPLLPYGTYDLREVGESVPETIQPWSWTAAGTEEDLAFDTVSIRSMGSASDGTEVYRTWKSSLIDYEKLPVSVSKYDDTNGQAVESTQFTLWVYDGAEIADGLVKTDAAAISTADPNWRKLLVASTGLSGIADFGSLAFGLYRIDESCSNPGYLSSEETGHLAFGTDTSRVFVLDRNHVYDRQNWWDSPIVAKAAISKQVTGEASNGLEFVVDEDGRLQETLADGIVRYEVDFGVGDANTDLDEYWVEDRCEMVESPYDMRIVGLELASVAAGTDKDGIVYLLAKTNRTGGGTATGMSFSQPELVAGSQATQSAFDSTGWDFWGAFDPYSVQVLDLAKYLEDGEYVTALALCFGAVSADFQSETPLVYRAKTQHAMAEGTVIPNTATASLSRNLQKEASLSEDGTEQGRAFGVFDTAEARVQTGVSERVVFDASSTGSVIVRTGDASAAAVFLLEAVAAAAALCAVAARRRKENR